MTKLTIILYHCQADLIWPEAPFRRKHWANLLSFMKWCFYWVDGGGGKNAPEEMKADMCVLAPVLPPPPHPHVGWLKYKIHISTATHTCPAPQKTGWKHVRFC